MVTIHRGFLKRLSQNFDSSIRNVNLQVSWIGPTELRWRFRDLSKLFKKWKKKYFKVFNRQRIIYTQYPIIRNGDQRWALEFLNIYQFPDADRILILQGWALAVS